MTDTPDPEPPVSEINIGRRLTVLQGAGAGRWPKLMGFGDEDAPVRFEYDTAERIIQLSSALIDFLEGSNGNLRSLLAVYDPPSPPRRALPARLLSSLAKPWRRAASGATSSKVPTARW